MAKEYIEREAAYNAIVKNYDAYAQLRELDAIPTADVRPVVRGRWIKLDMHNGMEQHKCSVCNQECFVPTCMGEPLYIYCPAGGVCRADNALGGAVMRDIIEAEKETERTAWERLIAGIIYCAVMDYLENYRRSLRFKPNSRQRNKAVCEMYLIERFFLSRWCAVLTGDNGEKILRLTKNAAKSGIGYCKPR